MAKVVSLDNLFSEIESEEFSIDFLHFHDTSSLVNYLNHNPTVLNLFDIVRVDEDYFVVLFERIKALWKYRDGEGNFHKFDSAISVYLYVIFRAFSEKVRDVMQYVFDNQLGNLWWTYYVYNYISRYLNTNAIATANNSKISPDIVEPDEASKVFTSVTESSAKVIK